MIYENYGLRFVRLKSEHLELLRYWRNHDSIRQFMEYQEIITSDMQKKWFESIQNTQNLYFLIEHDHNFIGMINGKDINLDAATAEGGMFVWDINFHNTELPIRATLSFADFAYLFIKIKKCYISVLKSNKKSKDLNTTFGYQLVEGEEDKENQKYVVEGEVFLDNTLYFKKHYKKVYKKQPSILFEKEDFENGWADFYLEKCCDDNQKHPEFLIKMDRP